NSNLIHRGFLEGLLDNDMKKIETSVNTLIDCFPPNYVDPEVKVKFRQSDDVLLYTYQRLSKQLSEFSTDIQQKFRDKIISHYEKTVRSYLDQANEKVRIMDVPGNPNIADQEKNEMIDNIIGDIWNALLDFGSLFVDAYGFARMLKA